MVDARKRMTAGARREVIEQAAIELFAERGYRGASVDEIARRAGITVPVLYDHFPAKRDLYVQLINRHYAELRGLWFNYAARNEPLGAWIGDAVDDWFAYVESNPFAGRMLFRDTTGDPEISAMHRDVQRASRGRLLPLVHAETAHNDGGFGDGYGAELVWEALRSVMQGLALWWYEHPDVPRERIVRAAIDAVWVGLERSLGGTDAG